MRINWYELQWFFLGFVAFTIIGTLTHELGHYTVAKAFGRDASINYGYSMPGYFKHAKELQSLYNEYETEIENDQPFPGQNRFEELKKESRKQSMLITLGGPLQTTLTGTIGLLLLFGRRKKIKEFGMKTLDWFLVFLSLFWLREPFNLLNGLVVRLFYNKTKFYDDESRLARHWDLPDSSVLIALGLIGFLVSLFVVFRILPKQKRLTFIIGGLTGGLFGFWFWLYLAGPILMP